MHVKPFGFDRVFHVAGSEPAAAEPDTANARPDAATLQARIAALQDELAALHATHHEALAQARTDGFNAGLDQARREREAAILSAADAIHAAVEQIDLRLDAAIGAMTRDAAALALAAGETLAAHAVALAPGRAIDEALDRVLHQVARGTQLTVKVHPDLLAEVEARIGVRIRNERRKLSITALGDAAVPMGDAQIQWDEGGVSLDRAAREAAVRAELAPLLDDAGG
jgi:flagellar assembly protein FliH